jgi:hypothetical protein
MPSVLAIEPISERADVRPAFAQDDATTRLTLIKRPHGAAIERAPRLCREDLPWLSAVRLPGGSKADLLNLSNTGMLLETSSKFAPGYSGAVQLCRADDEVIVPARFVRSEVGTVTARGVRYRAAVAFERTIDLDDLRVAPLRTDPTPNAVADWLQQMSVAVRRADTHGITRALTDGLMRLLDARNVEIRREPAPAPAGCESIYFTIANDEQRKAVLQVTFDAGQAPTAVDLYVLRAASSLAAAVFNTR